MTRSNFVRAALLAATLSCVPALALAQQQVEPAAAEPDSHAAHAAAAHHDAANAAIPATPFASDETMRTAMAAIAKARNAWRAEDPATTTALAGTIDASIGTMIANCRLAPDADAALHGIIGRLAQHAAALRKHTADANAIASIDAALDDYARTFDPPGFTR